jgi:PBP1b-binding outer membrane lipoprotein LpoB
MKRYLSVIVLTFLVIGCNSSIVDDPTTTIKYSVPELSHVKLYVENSYDTIIATLVDTVQQAGNYQVSFEINNLAEGIYFYTLKMTGESGKKYDMTKQMILIK